jgi:hypothetical protein
MLRALEYSLQAATGAVQRELSNSPEHAVNSLRIMPKFGESARN